MDPTIQPPPVRIHYDYGEDEDGFDCRGWRMLEPTNPNDLQNMLIVDGVPMQTMVNRMGVAVAYDHEGRLLSSSGEVVEGEDEDPRDEPGKFVNYYIDYY